MVETVDGLVEKGEQALLSGETLMALVHFETAYKMDPALPIKAKLAYCLARERRQMQKAAHLCREALQADPNDPDNYYQLGRIYLLARQKRQAIATFRKGLKIKRYQPIIEELQNLGLRKPPVFTSLPRDHFINRVAGQVFARIGSR